MSDRKPVGKSDSRIRYIDLAKAIGIILVIAGHVVPSDTVAKKVIYSFHMPLFFLLSGMLMRVREDYSGETWIALIIKKAQRLLVPYFLWALIYTSLSVEHTTFILYGSHETLGGAGSLTSLWFLPVMFLAYLAAEAVLQIVSRLDRSCMGIALGAIALAVIGFLLPHHPTYGNPWGIDIVPMAASFMLTGILLKAGIDKLSNTKVQVVIIIVSLIIFLATIRYSNSSVGYVLMSRAEYGNAALFLLHALLGCIIVLIASRILSGNHTECFQCVGQSTLGIFLIHKPVVEWGQIVVTELGFRYDVPCLVLLITAVTLALSYIGVMAIQTVIPEAIGLIHKTGEK